MSITPQDVEYVARLARLGLTPEEVLQYTRELGQVLAFVEQLQAVDTTGIEPTAGSGDLRTVMRADVVTESLPAEAVLKEAPASRDQQVQVRGVFL